MLTANLKYFGFWLNVIVTAANGLVYDSILFPLSSILNLRLLLDSRKRSNDSEPEPDIAIVRAPIRQYLTHHPYPADIFWLIEYADTTLRKDINEKKRVYASAGIQEYWVVNLQASELVVFRDLESDTYKSETILTTGNILPLSFPDIQIDVSRLFTI
jgi:Uma2 family endonuclease